MTAELVEVVTLWPAPSIEGVPIPSLGHLLHAGPVLDLDLPENKAITAVSADCRAHYSEGTFVIQCATWDSAESWSDLATVILSPHEEGTIRAEVTAELREN